VYTKLPSVLRALLLVGVLGLLTLPAGATIITGELNIIGGVRVDADEIDFLPLNGGTGAIIADPFTQEGYFTAVAGQPGTIKDLNVTTQPVGVPFSLPDFITFAGLPGFTMTLEFIDPGSFSSADCGAPPAAGQTCTPILPVGVSPYNLSNLTADSSSVSFNVRGFATDGSGDPVSPFVGTFTTQFSDQSLQELLATIEGGGSIDAAFSANFTFTPIPEPSTIAMVLIGGVAVVLGARRRRV
jgi:hypothetical protein